MALEHIFCLTRYILEQNDKIITTNKIIPNYNILLDRPDCVNFAEVAAN